MTDNSLIWTNCRSYTRSRNEFHRIVKKKCPPNFRLLDRIGKDCWRILTDMSVDCRLPVVCMRECWQTCRLNERMLNKCERIKNSLKFAQLLQHGRRMFWTCSKFFFYRPKCLKNKAKVEESAYEWENVTEFRSQFAQHWKRMSEFSIFLKECWQTAERQKIRSLSFLVGPQH